MNLPERFREIDWRIVAILAIAPNLVAIFTLVYMVIIAHRENVVMGLYVGIALLAALLTFVIVLQMLVVTDG